MSCRRTPSSAQYSPNSTEVKPVCAQHLELAARLHLSHRLEFLDHSRPLILARKEVEPHESTDVIHKQQEVEVATWSRRRDVPTYVVVHQVEDAHRSAPRLCRERTPPLLPRQTAITQLIRMINVREPAHHVSTLELLQRLEANVTETLVPAPRHISLSRRQADRACYVEANGVQPVGGAPPG